nr:hypothetical protein [Tanacetum cinerariifolium]
MASGVPLINHPNKVCEGCVLAKQTRNPPRTSGVVHAGLCGPITLTTVRGSKYFLVLINDFSRWSWVYMLSGKFRAFDAFRQYKKMIEENSGYKEKTLHSDRGESSHQKSLRIYVKKMGVWGEIGRIDPNPTKCPEDIKTYAKIRSDKKLFQFLNGLDRKFEPIKRKILRVDPLPTAEAAYTIVRKEAAHRNILGATNNEPHGIAIGLIDGETEGVGFVTKGYRRNDGTKKWVTRDDKSHLKCEKCGMSRHTKEQCFHIVGYPDWWTDGNKKGTKSAKTEKEKGTKSAKTEKEKVPTTNNSSINKENTSDGRLSDGGFGGLATAENKGI